MAQFHQLRLADIDPGAIGRFDTVFAVNVNLFWTRPAQRELVLVRELLTAQGQLWLFYEAPTTAVTSRTSTLIRTRPLRRSMHITRGFRWITSNEATPASLPQP